MAATPFKSFGCRTFVVCAVLYAGGAVALPAEHEIRRLMLATEQALAAENWDDASEYLGRLQQLDGERPVDFYFYRGRVMQKSGLLDEAQASLEVYVTQAGSEEQALLMHLNSVLQLSGWREDKAIVRLDQPADIRYQVEKRNSSLLIQKITRQQGTMLRNSQQIAVYGISPLVKWDCEPSLATCWVYDPRDGSRLFQLGANQGQAEDIARTLGRLIRNLQATGKQVALPPVSG